MQPITTLAPDARALSNVETQRLRRLLAAKGLRGADIDDAVQEITSGCCEAVPTARG